MSAWKSAQLSEVIELIGGGTPRTSVPEYWGGDIPWLSVKDFGGDRRYVTDAEKKVTQAGVENSSTQLLDAGDLVISARGTVGEVAQLTRPMAFNQSCYGVKSLPGTTDSNFLYYLMIFVVQSLKSLSHGSVFSTITRDTFRHIEVALPGLVEQAAIASTLGALDDKIESNLRAVTQALALARAFVDRATTGRPTVAYNTALQVLMGAAFKGGNFSEPGLGRPLLRIRDLKTFESQIWTTESRKDETVIRTGDIVVGMDAEFRATLWLGRESVLNQRVCSFRGKAGVGRAFVLAVLDPLLAFQERAKTGTTVIHLNKADIDTFEVPTLTTEEHRDLSVVTEPLIDLVVARALESRTLALARDTLLPQLLSGRIRVPDVSERVQEIAT